MKIFVCIMFISSNILICSPGLKMTVEGNGRLGLEQLSLELARCQIQDMLICRVNSWEVGWKGKMTSGMIFKFKTWRFVLMVGEFTPMGKMGGKAGCVIVGVGGYWNQEYWSTLYNIEGANKFYNGVLSNELDLGAQLNDSLPRIIFLPISCLYWLGSVLSYLLINKAVFLIFKKLLMYFYFSFPGFLMHRHKITALQLGMVEENAFKVC